MITNYSDLAISSFTSGLAVYLTYRVFALLLILKTKINSYQFGSQNWWHWIQHIIASIICSIGAFGFSMLNVYRTIDVYYDHENTETIMNTFVVLILFSMVILVNHMRAEEQHEFELTDREYPPNRRKISNRRHMHINLDGNTNA